MDIIVDKPQLVRAVILFLNKNFGELTKKYPEKYPNSIFFVNSDNEIIMEYKEKDRRVFIHHDKIWKSLSSIFSLDNDDIRSVLKQWLENDYKIYNLKNPHQSWKTTTDWSEITFED